MPLPPVTGGCYLVAGFDAPGFDVAEFDPERDRTRPMTEQGENGPLGGQTGRQAGQRIGTGAELADFAWRHRRRDRLAPGSGQRVHQCTDPVDHDDLAQREKGPIRWHRLHLGSADARGRQIRLRVR